MKDKRIDQIDFAVLEARRFIQRALAWKKRLREDSWGVCSSKEGGACKRSSMDLARELVKLRKSV